MKLKYIIPPLYERYFPKALWNSDVQETKATCHQCIQAPHKYSNDLKCCTFWPFIPNYVVGQILLSAEEKYRSAQALVRKHIQKQYWVLPMGLVAPPTYQVNFNKDKSKVFGRDEDFLCPYFSKQTNNCGLWLYRGSVCTSFFCESSYGKEGQEFWQKFENYYSYLEMGVSQEILAYKDFSPRDVNTQLDYFMVQKKIQLPKDKYKKMWKHFYGKEVDFYIEAARFAEEMPKSQIKEVLGETGLEIRNELEKAHHFLGLTKSEPSPKRVR